MSRLNTITFPMPSLAAWGISPGKADMKKERIFRLLALIELAAAAVAILLDLLIPTLVVLALMTVSLLLRRERLSSLGFREFPPRLILSAFLLAAFWTMVDFGLFLPLLNRLTGGARKLAAYETLRGDTAQLLGLLILGWTLAALGEETVYRGFLPSRIVSLIGNNAAGRALAVGISCALFGLAHREQGVTGVVVTALDALFFTWVKARHGGNLWAAVFAHGFLNTIGITVFFFTGPLYGLW